MKKLKMYDSFINEIKTIGLIDFSDLEIKRKHSLETKRKQTEELTAKLNKNIKVPDTWWPFSCFNGSDINSYEKTKDKVKNDIKIFLSNYSDYEDRFKEINLSMKSVESNHVQITDKKYDTNKSSDLSKMFKTIKEFINKEK